MKNKYSFEMYIILYYHIYINNGRLKKEEAGW